VMPPNASHADNAEANMFHFVALPCRIRLPILRHSDFRKMTAESGDILWQRTLS
jgi:hypothetical protein